MNRERDGSLSDSSGDHFLGIRENEGLVGTSYSHRWAGLVPLSFPVVSISLSDNLKDPPSVSLTYPLAPQFLPLQHTWLFN